MSDSRRYAILCLGALVLSGCVAYWARSGAQTHHIHRHLAVYALAFLAYAAVLSVAGALSGKPLGVALALALCWRAMLVPGPPLLSDDVNRYVWEGRIQLHGGNPYAWRDRPESERWTHLRDAVWERVNHKEYTAVYPPLWQFVSREVVRLHDSVTAMKAFLVTCELLMLWALAGLLRRRGLPPGRLLIAAWSPLALVEIAGSGHNEALAMLMLVLGLAALAAGRLLPAALLGGLAVQAKLIPAFVAAAWWRRLRARDLLAAGLLAMVFVLPYVGARQGLVRSLVAYGRYWRFNETLFAPLAALFGGQLPAVLVVVGLLTAWAVWLGAVRTEPAAAALGMFSAWLLLAPSVLPWYALWLLPWLVLVEAPGALLFTGTAALAYTVYPGWLAGGAWQVGWGVRALEYGPCVALAALHWVRQRSQPAPLAGESVVPRPAVHT